MPPRAGIAPWPLIAERTVASTPYFIRWLHAARSSILGAPCKPLSWHLVHWAATTCAPLRSRGCACARPANSTAAEAGIRTAVNVGPNMEASFRSLLQIMRALARRGLMQVNRM
jgi:hypothetical protein